MRKTGRVSLDDVYTDGRKRKGKRKKVGWWLVVGDQHDCDGGGPRSCIAISVRKKKAALAQARRIRTKNAGRLDLASKETRR